jgi:hypothetical protein
LLDGLITSFINDKFWILAALIFVKLLFKNFLSFIF